LILGVTKGSEWGWTSGRILLCLLISIGSVIGFIVVERRSPAPLIDLQRLRNKLLIGATLGILIGAGTINGLMFVASLYFQDPAALGMSPLEAGLATLPATIGLVSVGTLCRSGQRSSGRAKSSRSASRSLRRWFIALMAIKSVVGVRVFVIPFLAAAVGMSMSNGPCSSVSTSAVPSSRSARRRASRTWPATSVQR
jgi:hypothetical protein